MKKGGGVSRCSSAFGCLIRRKQIDSVNSRRESTQLAKRLSVFDLIAIGVGSTIGAGVYILVGTVAREQTGPALAFAFLIAGVAAGLSAFCYAELACRCPSAGSAYHYSYVCVGEGVAWLIGWALILEYTLGGAAVARGISPNLALFFGGEDKLPGLLARITIYGTVVDPCAAILVLVLTALLCTGIKESSMAQAVITTVNIVALIFIIIAGGYVGFKTGWVGYQLPSGYLPYGANGLLAGSATVFFSYVGFDAITSTAEEVKNPHRDLPVGIGISLSTCCILYMLVSIVVVGLVPCHALNPDTPISSAFASYGMDWAVYIITVGAVTALCAALIGGILPQPRILMAMARDGLLPSFFSEVHWRTHVPVNGTIVTGIFIATLAFFMDVSQLAGMVSVGTLLAFTAVAISILILRYVPPSVPVLIDSDSVGFNSTSQHADPYTNPLIHKHASQDEQKELKRRKIAAWSICIVCTGVLLLTSAVSAEKLPSIPRIIFSGVGGIILMSGLVVLTCIDQDNARLSFGHTGGFICPFVPLVPVTCILVNAYLLINLGGHTWIRVSTWMIIGVLVYVFYGRTHSSLLDSIYVPVTEQNNYDNSDINTNDHILSYSSSSRESLHKA